MTLFSRSAARQGTDADSGTGRPVKAVWNDVVLAESDATIVIEGNHYFPPESLNRQYFADSSRSTSCPWKGSASYYTIDVDGDRNEAAAWTYRSPKAAAGQIRDYVAFWQGVKVVTADA